MSNLTIKLSSDMNTAYVTKSFLKNSLIYGSDEYKVLKQFKAENPRVTVVAKEIKKNPDKVSYKGLSYENIETYIATLANAELLTKDYELTRKRSCIAKNPYRYVLNWFKNTCFVNDAEFDSYRKSIDLNNQINASQNFNMPIADAKYEIVAVA